MPVPTVITTTEDAPRAAPNFASPQAAALASFSTTVVMPVMDSTFCFRGSLRHARLGAKSTVARAASTNPAAPMPTASTSWLALSRLITSAITSAVLVVSLAGVGSRREAMMVPSASTTPAATLVPPTSTPIVWLALISDLPG